jgi:hypothetical protein
LDLKLEFEASFEIFELALGLSPPHPSGGVMVPLDLKLEFETSFGITPPHPSGGVVVSLEINLPED